MPTGYDEAAISLSAVSISFQIFAGCVMSLKLLTGAHAFGKDASLLICQLRLDEYRLILWAEKSGLYSDKLDPRLDRSLINSGLAELRLLFEDSSKLKEKYGLVLKEDDFTQQEDSTMGPASSSISANILERADIISKEEQILGRVKELNSPRRLVKRFWWAAVDLNGMERLVRNIDSIITRLNSVLDKFEKEDSLQLFKQLQLSLVSVTEKLSDMHLMQNIIHQTVTKDDDLSTVAALRRLKIDLEANSNQGPPLDEDSGDFASRQIVRPKPPVLQAHRLEKSSANTGTNWVYENQPVYVEMKRYDQADIDGVKGAVLAARVDGLVLLLNEPKRPSFRTLHCMGSIQDPRITSFLFLFKVPTPMPPRSLLSYFQSSYIPSVDERWRLAETAATTLLHLHASGWLHKGLRSENVLFFPAHENAPRSLEEPYFMGYEYARIDSPGEMSDKPSDNPAQAIYRHPSAQGPISETYIKAYDIYALGIMLIEIAYWKPFAKIIEKLIGKENVSAKLMESVRKSLLADVPTGFLQNIRFRVGNEFATAVEKCLRYTFEEPDTPPPEFLKSYFEGVVKPLQKFGLK